QRIAINERARDPFGLPQDLRTFDKGPKPPGPGTANPFPRFINSLPISAVDTLNRQMILGARTFGEGDIIPLVSGTHKLRVRVETVTSQAITFTNLENDDTATRLLAI
ncbi:MAG: hypothetical protein GWO24_20345, partial [Akkermansiaceae bacterium]|nr:hypothetical protein [Akkermansiaceae bacterium]